MRATPDHRSAAEGGHTGVVRRSTFRRVKRRLALEVDRGHSRLKKAQKLLQSHGCEFETLGCGWADYCNERLARKRISVHQSQALLPAAQTKIEAKAGVALALK